MSESVVALTTKPPKPEQGEVYLYQVKLNIFMLNNSAMN
jgi:hypothetical protein